MLKSKGIMIVLMAVTGVMLLVTCITSSDYNKKHDLWLEKFEIYQDYGFELESYESTLKQKKERLQTVEWALGSNSSSAVSLRREISILELDITKTEVLEKEAWQISKIYEREYEQAKTIATIFGVLFGLCAVGTVALFVIRRKMNENAE